jgi:TrkA-C domain
MPLFALLIIVAVALLIVRIGATALMMTGLSRDVAEFQAISCFFGVGFTTNEAEMIVGHPTRRRIAQHLIISGNIGLTGALGTVIMTLTKDDADWFDRLIPDAWENAFFLKLGLILVAILLIGAIFRLKIVKRLLEHAIQTSLVKFHQVRAMDYETVLRSSDGYAVMQFEIEPGHPMIGRTLAGVKLSAKGVLVLGIKRSTGEYIGAPHSTSDILEGDVLTVYGQEQAILSTLAPQKE